MVDLARVPRPQLRGRLPDDGGVLRHALRLGRGDPAARPDSTRLDRHPGRLHPVARRADPGGADPDRAAGDALRADAARDLRGLPHPRLLAGAVQPHHAEHRLYASGPAAHGADARARVPVRADPDDRVRHPAEGAERRRRRAEHNVPQRLRFHRHLACHCQHHRAHAGAPSLPGRPPYAVQTRATTCCWRTMPTRSPLPAARPAARRWG